MPIVRPTSDVITSTGNALNVNSFSSTVFIGTTIDLVADGMGHDALSVTSGGNIILTEGNLVSEDANAISITGSNTNTKVTIGESGNLLAGLHGFFSETMDDFVTNNGTITANSNGIRVTNSSATAQSYVVNNGSITSGLAGALFDEGGILTNTGTISSLADGVSFGAHDGTNSDSDFLNSGTVTADFVGVRFNGADVSLTNSGTILGRERGVVFEGSLTDDITFNNSGDITGSVFYGVHAEGDNGSFTNSGTVTGHVDGLRLSGENYEVVNTGTIAGTNEKGIYTVEDVVITNHGQIRGTTYGVRSESGNSATTGNGNHLITNTGTITAETNAGVFIQGANSSVVNAHGGIIASRASDAIRADSVNALITNDGSLSGFDDGVDIRGVEGVVNNTGSITARDDAIYGVGGLTVANSGSLAAEGYGIRAAGDVSDITNTGTISASDTAIYTGEQTFIANQGDISSEDYGIYTGASASIANSGNIATEDEAIYVDGAGGGLSNVSNSGVITVRNGDGIVVDGENDAYVSNSGTINAQANAIGAVGISELLQIENSGTLVGRGAAIDMNDTVTGKIIIHNSGSLSAEFFGLDLVQGAHVTNTGSIAAGTNGAVFYARTATVTDSVFVNSGVVSSGSEAVNFTSVSDSASLYNSGVLESYDSNAVEFASQAGEVTTTFNAATGVIRAATSSQAAVESQGASADRLTNAGLIDGNVDLGDGTDLYRGLGTGQTVGQVIGGLGADTLIGAAADDWFVGGDGTDRLIGHKGDDTLDGGADQDVLRGGDGDDSILAGDGDDQVWAGRGDDFVDAGLGRNTVYGLEGNDTILSSFSGGTRDDLRGGDGNDSIDGGSGWDFIRGGRGDDTLTGGVGNDDFVFYRNAGHDVITDFENNNDDIDLAAFNLVGGYATLLGSGAISGDLTTTVIDLSLLGGTGTITLEGFNVGNMSLGDFLF